MNARLNKIHKEILEKCREERCDEFEYYWEIWGVMWYPWTIEINGKSASFSFNDLSSDDLEELRKLGRVSLLKNYETDEMDDEFDRKRFKILP